MFGATATDITAAFTVILTGLTTLGLVGALAAGVVIALVAALWAGFKAKGR